jgi:hypothetical protein
MSISLPHCALNSSGLPSSVSLGKILAGTRLVSNLGLAKFVSHLVKLVKQFLQPALRKREKKKKQLKGRDLMVFFIFAPYHSKAFRFSLSYHRTYMLHRIYRGTNVFFIRSPHPCLCRGPLSGM